MSLLAYCASAVRNGRLQAQLRLRPDATKVFSLPSLRLFSSTPLVARDGDYRTDRPTYGGPRDRDSYGGPRDRDSYGGSRGGSGGFRDRGFDRGGRGGGGGGFDRRGGGSGGMTFRGRDSRRGFAPKTQDFNFELQSGTVVVADEQIQAKFEDLLDGEKVPTPIVNTLIKQMKLENMTPVQSATLDLCLEGKDVLGQAKTGTGKTLAFLLPIVSRILKSDPKLLNYGRASPKDIRALIISPTRELAEQIAVEAKRVVAGTGLVVQTAVGGTSKAAGLRELQYRGCHILVGTPGRLGDILSDPQTGVSMPKMEVLVLDEADRLLDSGFSQDIKELERYFPDKNTIDRQTLMFSATMPKEVMQMVDLFMKEGYAFVQTIKPGDEQTHERVPQKVVHARGMENVLPAVFELCKREINNTEAEQPFKAIIFFNSLNEIKIAKNIFRKIKSPDSGAYPKNALAPTSIVDLSSGLTQQQRTRNADEFRNARTAILFASDVAARGMDFPNVTHVIQVGLPASGDAYIHRLGRTARANKKGEGWLFLSPCEESAVYRRVPAKNLVRDDSLACASIDMTQDGDMPASVAEMLTQVIQSAKTVPFHEMADAQRSQIGSMQALPNKVQLVRDMNNRARFLWGLDSPPKMAPALADKLGFRGIPDLAVGFESRYDESKNAYESRQNDRFGDRSGGFGGRFGGNRGGSGGRFGGDRGGFGGGRDGGRFGRERAFR